MNRKQITNATAVLIGDCLDGLRSLPADSVHCCVTSPPYWGLRSYLPADHPAKSLELGSERTPEEYVAKLVAIFAEVRRVLRPDGTLWLNLGDSYNAHPGQRNTANLAGKKQQTNRGSVGAPSRSCDTLKPKDLVGIPWRVALALQADGWWLRDDVIWHKPSPMPGSQRDRTTKAHEYVFMLTKARHYFYDDVAIREPSSGVSGGACFGKQSQDAADTGAQQRTYERPEYATRTRRSVWTVASRSYPGAHFAVFPPQLIEPCVLAGTSAAGCCPQCGAPWERQVERPTRGRGYHDHEHDAERGIMQVGDGDERKLNGDAFLEWRKNNPIVDKGFAPGCDCYVGKSSDGVESSRRMLLNLAARRKAGGPHDNQFPEPVTTGWQPTCDCQEQEGTGQASQDGGEEWRLVAPAPVPCTVLDPFGGSGTTAGVAEAHGRRAILCELSPDYVELMPDRIAMVIESLRKPKKAKRGRQVKSSANSQINLFP